ncbi:MAG: hypothetical protein J6B24_04505 [Clostridia bacterium]|nr:hypothetical protein [Clostridia bacterium]
MKNAKRVASLLLALLLGVSLLLTAVSCGESTEDPVGSDDATASGTQAETETESPYDKLDKEPYDREFTVLVRDDCVDDFVVEGMKGDVLGDSLYERNTVVSDDFGVTFAFNYQGNSYSAVNEAVKQQVNGGLDDYDTYIGHKYSFTNLAMSNYLYDMGKIASIDLSGAWWDQGCYENLTVGGHTYVMTGDILPDSSMRISSCMVFNKDLMAELNKSVEELNDTAKNGGFTLDVLNTYCKDVTLDLNGDSKFNYMDDRYCLTGWKMAAPYAMFYGAGGMFVTIEDGTPEVTYTDEKVTGIYEKLYSLIVDGNAYHVTNEAQYDTMFDVFTEGRALFSTMTLRLISQYLSEMEDAYGILPEPKFDTYQEEYLSFVNGSTSLVMIAKTEEDPEFVGTVMEAMATYNYTHVTPNMFQVVTKLQAAQDPESAAMVDLIIRNRVFDLGYFADLGVTNLVRDSLISERLEIASSLQSGRKAAERALTKLLANMEKFD